MGQHLCCVLTSPVVCVRWWWCSLMSAGLPRLLRQSSCFFVRSADRRARRCGPLLNFSSGTLPDKQSQIHEAVEKTPSPKPDVTFSRILTVGASSFTMMSGMAVIHMCAVDTFCIENALLLGSLGASCFLLCLSPEVAIAQPRNVIGGHLVGASCGILSNSFVAWLQLSRLDEIIFWDAFSAHFASICAGPLAVSTACMLMMFTKTIHFPAAGTALGTSLSPDMTILLHNSCTDIAACPEVLTHLGNVFFSSSTLVSLAFLLHRGSYPHNGK